MAKLVLQLKLITSRGHIEERVIWEVPQSGKYPEGIRYRLAYVCQPGKEVVVLYDNHHPKGHHKHLRNTELPYAFSSVEKLIEDFEKDMEEDENRENA